MRNIRCFSQFCFFLLILLSNSLFAENEYDILDNNENIILDIINELDDNSIKVEYLLEVAKSSRNPNQRVFFTKKAQKLSIKIQHPEGLIKTYLLEAEQLVNKKSFQEAYQLLSKALRVLSQKTNPILQAKVKSELSLVLFNLNRLEEAESYQKQAIEFLNGEIRKGQNPHNRYSLYLSNFYVKNGEFYLKQLKQFNKAEHFFELAIEVKLEKIKSDYEGIARAYIGKALSIEENPDRLLDAYTAFNRALNFLSSEKNAAAEAQALIYLALNENKQGRPKSAIDDLEKAYEKAIECGDQYLQALAQIEMAFIHLKQGDKFQSYMSLEKGLPIFECMNPEDEEKLLHANLIRKNLGDSIENFIQPNQQALQLRKQFDQTKSKLKKYQDKDSQSKKNLALQLLASALIGIATGILIKSYLFKKSSDQTHSHSDSYQKDSTTVSELNALFQQGNLREVLEKMKNKKINKSLIDNAILCQGRLNNLEKDQIRGTLTFEDQKVELGKISESVLAIINQYKAEKGS